MEGEKSSSVGAKWVVCQVVPTSLEKLRPSTTNTIVACLVEFMLNELEDTPTQI